MCLLRASPAVGPPGGAKNRPRGRAGAKPRTGGVMPPSRGAHVLKKNSNTAQTRLKFNANIGEFVQT